MEGYTRSTSQRHRLRYQARRLAWLRALISESAVSSMIMPVPVHAPRFRIYGLVVDSNGERSRRW
jgi:hypothetical protein